MPKQKHINEKEEFLDIIVDYYIYIICSSGVYVLCVGDRRIELLDILAYV